MSEPLVSICIGAYNRKDYIRECVDSALAQTWSNKEVIVVDDASTDGTREILKTYRDSIRLILRDQNSGICPITRNQAAQAARGEFIAFLDSDDLWYPEKLARQMKFMLEHPDVPLCHTLCNVINEKSEVVGVRHGLGVVPGTGMIFERLLEHCWVTISSVMVRRKLFEEVGWFNPDPPYGYLGEDHEFFLRVSRRYAIGFVPEPLVGYRKAGQGITAKNWKASPEAAPLFEALIGRTDIWKGVVPKRRMVRAHSDACIANAEFWRANGERSRAIYFCRRGLRRDPLNAKLWREAFKSVGRALVPRRNPS